MWNLNLLLLSEPTSWGLGVVRTSNMGERWTDLKGCTIWVLIFYWKNFFWEQINFKFSINWHINLLLTVICFNSLHSSVLAHVSLTADNHIAYSQSASKCSFLQKNVGESQPFHEKSGHFDKFSKQAHSVHSVLIVCIVVSTPLSFLPSLPFKWSMNKLSTHPIFRQSPPLYRFFVNPP